MKAFGYKKNSRKLIELCEVSFQSSIEELEKMIEFLQDVKAQHSSVINKTDLCHSHYRDWDTMWKDGSIDIVVVTINPTSNLDCNTLPDDRSGEEQ